MVSSAGIGVKPKSGFLTEAQPTSSPALQLPQRGGTRALSKAQRRRLAAIFRLAFRVLGMGERRRIGTLGRGAAMAAALAAMGILAMPQAALAQYVGGGLLQGSNATSTGGFGSIGISATGAAAAQASGPAAIAIGAGAVAGANSTGTTMAIGGKAVATTKVGANIIFLPSGNSCVIITIARGARETAKR